MGGDNRGDTGNGTPTDAATQHVLDQLNAKFAQDAGQQQQQPPPTRAGYGAAPLTDNLGQKPASSDPYYHGTQPGGRAGYGVSGTLAPGGAGTATNKPGGEQVPDFKQIHADQQRNPNQPYTPNPIGNQAAGQMQGQGRPGGGQPVDTNESRIMSAISKRGQYLSPWTPAFGGLGSVTAPLTAKALSKGADLLVDNTKPTNIFNKAGKYWQDNYDITKVGKADLIKPVAKTAAADGEFATLMEAQRKLVASADPAVQALAKERLELLNRPLTASTTVDIAATNTARAASGGTPLFTEAEMATIDGKYAASLSRAAQEQAVIDGLKKSTPSAWNSVKAGVLGVGIDIAAVNVDRSLAKAIGGENSLLHSWNTEQILAPTALALGETLVGKSFWGKAALVAGTIGVSRLIDGGSQAVGLGAPEKWNAVTGVMNGWDGFGIATGLAIAASTKNPYAKAIAVGAGWALPKVVHMFEDNSSNALAYQYENLTEKISSDHKSRSYSSLEGVTEASIAINSKKEDWIVGKIDTNRKTIQAQWGNMGPDQKLLSFRDDAGMSAAIGEYLLKKGTRVASQGDPKYTLGGYEMDLGGRAMHYLVSGKDSVDRAEGMTKAIIANNNDSSKQKILVNGSQPSQSEVDGLDKFKGDIQGDLSKILDNKHDVQAVVNQVVKDAPPSSDDWRRTYITPTDDLIEHYVPRNQPDQVAETKKVIGKLYRDQAIAYLAFAEYQIEHGHGGQGDGQGALDMLLNNTTAHDIFPSGRQKNYNGAEGVIKMAKVFDPDAKDLAEIDKIWQTEVAKARTLAGQQMTNPNNNILNNGGMAPRPAGQ